MVQRAVFADRRLRLVYAAPGATPRRRAVDPIGRVHAGGHWYLLATHRGADRTYRVSRITDATVLDEPAAPRPDVPLAELWQQRRRRFQEELPECGVRARLRAGRRADVVRTVLAMAGDGADAEGWLAVELTFADRAHAVGVLWSLDPDVRVAEPEDLRAQLADRAAATLAGHHR